MRQEGAEPRSATPLPRGASGPAPPGAQGSIVDCGVYEDGCRVGEKVELETALERASRSGDGFAWIGLHEPSEAAVELVGRHFDLPPLAVEDAVHAHQRPKLEVYGDTLFVVLKTARYEDTRENVVIGEVMLFVGPSFAVTVRHGDGSPLAGVREDVEAHRDLLRLGPSAVLYAVADRIVDDYAVVLQGLSNDIDEVEVEVFSSGTHNAAERIYRLKREVLEFKRAIMPLRTPIARLAEGRVELVDSRTTEYFNDVQDHLLRDLEQVQAFDELLTGVLQANLAQLSVRDNQDMRKISAWVAIGVVPTMVFGIYGMNFEAMPELGWELGYPMVLATVLVFCAALFVRFKRAGWL